MNPPDQDHVEDLYAEFLAGFDDRLQHGQRPVDENESVVPAHLQDRVKAGRDFLLLLESIWPRRRLPRAGDDASAGPLHAVPRFIGRFEIRRVLGQGGTGIVYLAHDPLLSREVAIKVPRLEMVLTATFRQRFLREAQAAAALDHPNIIATLEVGEAEGLCFIVYPYCPNATLAEWLATRTAAVAVSEAVAIIERLAEAIAHAHQHGIIHRDLKPSNVLLGSEVSTVKITDFGLAKFADAEDITRTGVILGTPAYMAPEQTRCAKNLGPTCDVWALGVMLYELLTRQRPFQGATALETMKSIQETDPVSLAKLRSDTPRDLQAVCAKCLAKDPAQRYAGALELAADLRRFQQGVPVVRPADRVVGVLAKKVNRRLVATALVLVGLLVAVTANIGTLAHLERREEPIAIDAADQSAGSRAIAAKYAQPGVAAVLGLPTTPVQEKAGDPGARVRGFRNGVIVWSEATGAHYFGNSAIADRYNSPKVGAALGLPTRDEAEVAGMTGVRTCGFQRGVIFWSRATGAHFIGNGGIADKYNSADVGAALGIPITDEQDVRDAKGARVCGFQRGVIYWSAATGAHFLGNAAIADKYNSAGVRTELGLPVSDESDVVDEPGTRVCTFQNGMIRWSAETGAVVLPRR